MTIKRLVRASLRWLGIELRRYIPERDPVYALGALVRGVNPTVFVDAGCNRGQFYREFIMPIHHHWTRTVFIDPIREAVEDVRSRAKDHDVTGEYHACALGAEEGEVQLNISGRETSSSLFRVTEASTARIDDTRVRETRNVQIRRLDRLLGKPGSQDRAFMKLDVQGAENDVLDGAGEWLSYADILRVELSNVELYERQALAPELLHRLWTAGFVIAQVDPGWVDKETGVQLQWDVTVVKSDCLANLMKMRTQ